MFERKSFCLLAVIVFIGCAAIVQAAGLANGSDKGSIAGNVWYPGRTGGVVNQASWETVPLNQWMFVNDTMLQDLEAEIVAAMPGWRDPSSQKWGGTTEAWNSVAIDEKGHRAWWVAAGGHADGANNGIYRFDAFNMKYSIEHMPSDTTKWSSDYYSLKNTNTYTACGESSQIYEAKKLNGTIQPINDWFYDELYWDRQPTSRHVYNGAVYAPERDELILAVRRVWRYSRAQGKWIYKVAPPNFEGLGEENIAHYDQKSDQVLALSCGSGGPWGNILSLTNNSWIGGWVPGTGWDWNSAMDYRFNNTITIVKGIEPEAQYASPGIYMQYDITTRAVLTEPADLKYGPGIKRSDFESEDGNGVVYIPTYNRFWVAQRYKGKQGWFEIDPTTSPWTFSILNANLSTFPTLASGKTLVRKRMMYLPNMNAILWLGSASRNVQVYRIGAYVPPAPDVSTTTTTTASASTVTTGATPVTTGSSTPKPTTTGSTPTSTPKPTTTGSTPTSTPKPTTTGSNPTSTPKPTTTGSDPSASSSSGSPAFGTTTNGDDVGSGASTVGATLSVVIACAAYYLL